MKRDGLVFKMLSTALALGSQLHGAVGRSPDRYGCTWKDHQHPSMARQLGNGSHLSYSNTNSIEQNKSEQTTLSHLYTWIET